MDKTALPVATGTAFPGQAGVSTFAGWTAPPAGLTR
jgi:hypothetical protein